MKRMLNAGDSDGWTTVTEEYSMDHLRICFIVFTPLSILTEPVLFPRHFVNKLWWSTHLWSFPYPRALFHPIFHSFEEAKELRIGRKIQRGVGICNSVQVALAILTTVSLNLRIVWLISILLLPPSRIIESLNTGGMNEPARSFGRSPLPS